MTVVYLNIVDLLGKRLYAGRISWLREYVQNSIDAGGHEISIELKDHDLLINDDGSGISETSLREDAFSPGGSSKQPWQIGELGVGIYAGTGICDQIKILTKESNRPAYEATFDVLKYKDILDADPKALFDDHIDEIYTIQPSTENFPAGSHFTKLMLVNLDSTSLSNLKGEMKSNWQQTDIQHYLEKTVDLPINKDFQLKTEVEKFIGKPSKTFDITIKINGEITNIRKFMFVDASFIPYLYQREVLGHNGKPILRAWAAYSEDGKEVPGTRFLVRFKGMTVGDENTIASKLGLRVEKRLIGEIMAYSDDLQINTERDWFIEGDALEELSAFISDVRAELFYIANFDSTRMLKRLKLKNTLVSLKKEISQISPTSSVGKDLSKQIESVEKEISSLEEETKERLKGFEVNKRDASKPAVDLFSSIYQVREKVFDEIGKNIKDDKNTPTTEVKTPVIKKSPVPKTVHNFLAGHIVDPALGKRIKDKDDVKDLSNNAFTHIEVLLKDKAGVPEKQHINFEPLIDKFFGLYKPKDVPSGEITRFNRSTKQYLLSVHYFWRNASAHTFMEDIRDDRFLYQAIMLADFGVKLIEDYEKK